MGDLLQPWHIIVLAILVFVLFGAKRLPELGKGLGEGIRGFKDAIKNATEATDVTKPEPVKTESTTKTA